MIVGDDKVRFWIPGISGAFWKVSSEFAKLGQPFTLTQVELRPSKSALVPEFREVCFLGYYFRNHETQDFHFTREIKTKTRSFLAKWHKSEQLAFLALSQAFVSQHMPFTLKTRSISLDRGPFSLEKRGRTSRVVTEIVTYEGQCDLSTRTAEFTASIKLETNETLDRSTDKFSRTDWKVVKDGSKITIR